MNTRDQYLERMGLVRWELRAAVEQTSQAQANPIPESSAKTPEPAATAIDVSGNPAADWMIVAEAFSDEAGELFDNMLRAIGLERANVFLGSITEAGARAPSQCAEQLQGHLASARAKLVLCMGTVAAQGLLDSAGIEELRGKTHRLADRTVIVTYHPAQLLQEPTAKRAAWQDLQFAMQTVTGATA